MNNQIAIKEVIFHDPATIVYWGDGTKTVVKCMEDDVYNPEFGMAMCMLKRIMDPKSYSRYKKDASMFIKKDADRKKKSEEVSDNFLDSMKEAISILLSKEVN